MLLKIDVKYVNRLLYARGLATAKARSEKVRRLVAGTTSLAVEAERSRRRVASIATGQIAPTGKSKQNHGDSSRPVHTICTGLSL